MPPRSDARGGSVCFITTAHHTTDSRVVHREAVSLSEAGYDVTYYTPFEDECPVDVVSYDTHQSGSTPPIRDRIGYAWKLLKLLRDTDYDVYHIHNVELLPTAVVLGSLTGGDVVYDVHENVADVLAYKDFVPDWLKPAVTSGVSTVELGLSRFLDGIVLAAPDLRDRFEGFDEVRVVTNYPRRRWAEETDLDGRYEQPDGAPVQFVYCGLLSEYRGILTLIDAIDRVPDGTDVSLVLGGEYASETARQRIESRAADSVRVELLGWLPTFADVIDRFRTADVGLMCFHPDPNKTDAVHRSNKLFQYMAAGLPIIVSDFGEWPQFVDEIGCGVAVDPLDPDDIAATMTALAEDPDRRAELGRRGHDAALERFNWESERRELLDLYHRLVGDAEDPASEPRRPPKTH